MTRLNPLSRFSLVSFAASFAVAPLFAQDRPASDAIFGALRISSLDELATSVGSFADRVEPGSGASTAQLTAGAAGFGFATDQELLALVIDPQKSSQPYALVLPVADPEQFKANPAFDFQPVATSPDRYQIKLPNGQPMFAAFVGKRLVLSPLEAGLDAVLPAIRAGEDVRQLRAAGGQVALSLSADRLYTAYKPMVDLMLMGMRGQFEKTASKNPQAPNPADIFGSMLGSLAEVQEYAVSITIAADHLDLRSVIAAKPGTDTAALFSAGRGAAVGIPASFDASSSVFGTVSARPGPEFWAAYERVSNRLLTSFGAFDAASSKALTQTVNDFAAIWDGTGSFAMFPPAEGMSGSGTFGITDREKTVALIRRLPDLQKSMAAVNASQGLATEASLGGEEEHGSALLIDITQNYRALKPEMEEGLKLLQKAGMDKLTATYGVTSSRLLYAMGNKSHAEAKRLLDAPSAVSTEITPAAYGLPAETTAFAAVSLPRYFAWISRIGGLPFSVEADSAAQKPGLAFSTDLVDGRADIRVRLAASEIDALRSAFAKRSTATPADEPAK
jgi:hypothetical protein